MNRPPTAKGSNNLFHSLRSAANPTENRLDSRPPHPTLSCQRAMGIPPPEIPFSLIQFRLAGFRPPPPPQVSTFVHFRPLCPPIPGLVTILFCIVVRKFLPTPIGFLFGFIRFCSVLSAGARNFVNFGGETVGFWMGFVGNGTPLPPFRVGNRLEKVGFCGQRLSSLVKKRSMIRIGRPRAKESPEP
jgi:hypothetical protein